MIRDLHGKALAFNRRVAIIACDLEASLGPGLAFRCFVFEKGGVLIFALLSPLRAKPTLSREE